MFSPGHLFLREVRRQSDALTEQFMWSQQRILTSLFSPDSSERFQEATAHLCAYELAVRACWQIQRTRDAALNADTDKARFTLMLRVLTQVISLLSGASRQHPLFFQERLNDFAGEVQASLDLVMEPLVALLAHGLTGCLLCHLGEHRLIDLDAQPFWRGPVRLEAVELALWQLANDGVLDQSYADIARGLAEIEVPRDLHGQHDYVRRASLPVFLGRLPVADLLTLIATLQSRFFVGDLPIELSSSRIALAVGQLMQQHALVQAVPRQNMHMEVLPDALALLEGTDIARFHEEPCLLCSTHGGSCGYWQVTFPEGTVFASEERDESEQEEHVQCFTPTLPGGMTTGLRVQLLYSPVWRPDHPWSLLAFDLKNAPSR